MGELVQQNQQSMMTALVPRNIPEAVQLAETMAKANLVPEHLRSKPGDCLLVVMQAQRWGMDVLSVAQCTSVVRGKLCYEGKLVAAALYAMSAIDGRLRYDFSGSGEERRVTITGRVRGAQADASVSGTVAQWKTDNGNWKKDPDSMLVYRGTRQWARLHAPEVMLGINTPDEFDDAPTAATVTLVPRGEEPSAYPDADFTTNLPKWRHLIDSGKKTADEIISMVETRGVLSDAQREKIRGKQAPQPDAGVVEGELVQTGEAA